ncbi:hypothetical protein [Mycobacterium kyogaense]|uniref:hypothetical protein n=1 Tax=Mycobacterium kyogaense TaxID=2212479 RepID=UPI000DAC762F|nr:hypothetical protein [Mycobacterium kyogaense]
MNHCHADVTAPGFALDAYGDIMCADLHNVQHRLDHYATFAVSPYGLLRPSTLRINRIRLFDDLQDAFADLTGQHHRLLALEGTAA